MQNAYDKYKRDKAERDKAQVKTPEEKFVVLHDYFEKNKDRTKQGKKDKEKYINRKLDWKLTLGIV